MVTLSVHVAEADAKWNLAAGQILTVTVSGSDKASVSNALYKPSLLIFDIFVIRHIPSAFLLVQMNDVKQKLQDQYGMPINKQKIQVCVCVCDSIELHTIHCCRLTLLRASIYVCSWPF